MIKTLTTLTIPALAIVVVVGHVLAAELFVDDAGAQAASDSGIAGEFAGQLIVEEDERGKMDVGLEVTASGDNHYQAILFYGGLPDEQSSPVADEDIVELEGTYEDFTLELTGDIPLRFQFIHGRFTALDEENNYMGHLDRVVRVSPES